METRHLKIFVAVFKTRSFTKAAEILHTSQPTISEHMRNLEDRLGCRLFDRLGRSISPTPEAQLLFPKAMGILQEMEHIKDTLASTANNVAGPLTIGASTIPGAYVLPTHAALFKTRYPAVSFEITINDSARILKDVADHTLYLGVVGARTPSNTLEYTPFGGDKLILAAKSGSPLPDEIDPQDLPGLDFLLREEGSGTGKNVENFLNEIGIHTSQLQVRATLGSSTAIKEAIKSDLGVAIISQTAIRDELAGGALKEIRIRGLSMERSFYIATARKRTMPNHYLVFFDYLKKATAGN